MWADSVFIRQLCMFVFVCGCVYLWCCVCESVCVFSLDSSSWACLLLLLLAGPFFFLYLVNPGFSWLVLCQGRPGWSTRASMCKTRENKPLNFFCDSPP